jgi:hypothetical protein
MHAYIVEDDHGNMVDVIYFCSDACHQMFCRAHPDLPYRGWNGCHEGGDSVEFCAHCGVVAGGTYQCNHQRDVFVVNRFRCDEGEQCECGHWLQLPASLVERMG